MHIQGKYMIVINLIVSFPLHKCLQSCFVCLQRYGHFDCNWQHNRVCVCVVLLWLMWYICMVRVAHGTPERHSLCHYGVACTPMQAWGRIWWAMEFVRDKRTWPWFTVGCCVWMCTYHAHELLIPLELHTVDIRLVQPVRPWPYNIEIW